MKTLSEKLRKEFKEVEAYDIVEDEIECIIEFGYMKYYFYLIFSPIVDVLKEMFEITLDFLLVLLWVVFLPLFPFYLIVKNRRHIKNAFVFFKHRKEIAQLKDKQCK